jgi:hypothetical protein
MAVWKNNTDDGSPVLPPISIPEFFNISARPGSKIGYSDPSCELSPPAPFPPLASCFRLTAYHVDVNVYHVNVNVNVRHVNVNVNVNVHHVNVNVRHVNVNVHHVNVNVAMGSKCTSFLVSA